MAQDLNCRPAEIKHFQFFSIGVTFEKNYSMNFNARRTKLLKMYSSMAGRVGNI